MHKATHAENSCSRKQVILADEASALQWARFFQNIIRPGTTAAQSILKQQQLRNRIVIHPMIAEMRFAGLGAS